MSTYWRRVRHEGNSPPWILRSEEGRGMVAYASRNFAPGDRICGEFPVVWVLGHHPFNQEQIADIISKTDLLSDEDKEAFYSMANVFANECHPAVGIFMTNCFDMTDSIYGTSCAMYLALARLNHSCAPNAQQTHLPDTAEEILYACREIRLGDEINDCYIDLRQTRQQRRKELMEYYRFHCSCPGCIAISIENDDLLRIQAWQAIDTLTGMIEQGQLDGALTYALVIAKQLSKISVLIWSIRYLPELFLCIHEIATAMGNKSIGRKYLDKAHRLNLMLQGEHSVDSKKTAALLSTKVCK
jgi:hypothetical protein